MNNFHLLIQDVTPTNRNQKRFKVSNNKREQALKEAYWNETKKTNDLENEFWHIYDYINSFFEIEKPTEAQAYAIYNILPKNIVHTGFEWTFNNSVVRDNMFDFFHDNEKEIKEYLKEVGVI